MISPLAKIWLIPLVFLRKRQTIVKFIAFIAYIIKWGFLTTYVPNGINNFSYSVIEREQTYYRTLIAIICEVKWYEALTLKECMDAPLFS